MSGLERLLPPERIELLRTCGVLVFDVDDTLLSRRTNAHESDQSFFDSPAAQMLPKLLSAGLRVCVITGHGWAQLERRLMAPIARR